MATYVIVLVPDGNPRLATWGIDGAGFRQSHTVEQVLDLAPVKSQLRRPGTLRVIAGNNERFELIHQASIPNRVACVAARVRRRERSARRWHHWYTLRNAHLAR